MNYHARDLRSAYAFIFAGLDADSVEELNRDFALVSNMLFHLIHKFCSAEIRETPEGVLDGFILLG